MREIKGALNAECAFVEAIEGKCTKLAALIWRKFA
jgi:hypothetical protein